MKWNIKEIRWCSFIPYQTGKFLKVLRPKENLLEEEYQNTKGVYFKRKVMFNSLLVSVLNPEFFFLLPDLLPYQG